MTLIAGDLQANQEAQAELSALEEQRRLCPSAFYTGNLP